jgi:hypothetical protein
MKLVHKPLTRRIFSLGAIAAATAQIAGGQESKKPPYLAFFNPANGFKPAQTNLTHIFLQLAGSLEHSGTPEGYLRHMQKEHARIAAKFSAKTGKPYQGRLPTHMTDAYVDKLIANWNLLSPKLKLDALAKDAGRCAREGIRGTRDTGTIAVEIFNQHQKIVADEMASGAPQKTGFEELRKRLEVDLEYNKKEISMVGYDGSRRDAISYALIFEGIQADLFDQIDKAIPPAKANQIKAAITGVFMDLGRMAQSELEIGIVEWALDH